jgi:hypothetical protein
MIVSSSFSLLSSSILGGVDKRRTGGLTFGGNCSKKNSPQEY